MIGAVILALALLQPEQGKPGDDQRAGSQGAGIEPGVANGMAGGRNDMAPGGETSGRGEKGPGHERDRAKANSQARGRNKRGSFARPASSRAQMNRHPKPVGSGGPSAADEAQAKGK